MCVCIYVAPLGSCPHFNLLFQPWTVSQGYTNVRRKRRTWNRRTRMHRANWSSGGVAQTSPWSSWTSWSGSSTRRTTRTPSWERSWASGWDCPRPGCRWGSNPHSLSKHSRCLTGNGCCVSSKQEMMPSCSCRGPAACLQACSSHRGVLKDVYYCRFVEAVLTMHSVRDSWHSQTPQWLKLIRGKENCITWTIFMVSS